MLRHVCLHLLVCCWLDSLLPLWHTWHTSNAGNLVQHLADQDCTVVGAAPKFVFGVPTAIDGAAAAAAAASAPPASSGWGLDLLKASPSALMR